MSERPTQLAVCLPGELLRGAAITLGIDSLTRSQLLRYFASRRAGRNHDAALDNAYGRVRPATSSDKRFVAEIQPDVLAAAMANMPDGASQGYMIRSALYEFGLLISHTEALKLARATIGRPKTRDDCQT